MPTAGVTRSTVTIRRSDVEVFEAGAGSPLLLLHGLSDPSRSLEAIGVLARRRRVIAPSLPGYGHSTRPAELDSIDDLAYLILDLLERVGSGAASVDLVGCSIGAWVAAETAVRSDAAMRRLVLSTPLGLKVGGVSDRDVFDLYAHSPAETARALYHDPAFGALDLAAFDDDELAVHFRNLESTALFGWKPYLHDPKLRGRLDRISTPVLIITGASDGFVSPEIATAFRDGIAGAQLTTIPEAGHQPEREQPAAFGAAVLEFLDTDSSPLT